MVCKRVLALSIAALTIGFTTSAALAQPAPKLSPERRAQEAAFMKSVKPNQTPNDMTANVLAHVGERVAYMCEIEELTRPGVLVGSCGSDEEGVNVYIKMGGKWREGDKFRVLGILDTPASWSDVSGHAVYYPFIKAVFVDRLP